MAGHPEIPSNQTAINAKIAADYCEYALKYTLPKKLDCYGASFDSAQYRIFNEIRTKLPDSLCKTLGLQNLFWTSFTTEKSLATILVGKENGEKPFNTDYRDAIATIEIARKKKFDEKINDWNDTPLFLRVAGINNETKKIVMTTHDLTKNNKPISKINISTSEEDLAALKQDGLMKIIKKRILQQTMTSKFDKFELHSPYYLAGLITPEMRKRTGVTPDNQMVFLFEADAKSNIIPVKQLYSTLNTESIFAIFFDLGFHIKKEDDLIRIGLKGDKPWEICVPEFLQNA